MADSLLKDKNEEPSKEFFEPLETDDKPDEPPKKNRKTNFFKYLLAFIAIALIIAIIICYQKLYKPLNDINIIMQK